MDDTENTDLNGFRFAFISATIGGSWQSKDLYFPSVMWLLPQAPPTAMCVCFIATVVSRPGLVISISVRSLKRTCCYRNLCLWTLIYSGYRCRIRSLYSLKFSWLELYISTPKLWLAEKKHSPLHCDPTCRRRQANSLSVDFPPFWCALWGIISL